MSALGKEIITLQFGGFSNYIGTHWWNLQEAAFSYDVNNPVDINNDVLFKEGQTTQGEVTFTPRLILADLKGSLGTLPEDGGLYEKQLPPEHSLALWDQNKVELEIEPPLEKNEFLTDLDQQDSNMNVGTAHNAPKRYHLEESINYWSDYSRTFFHPQSLVVTNQYKLNDDVRAFNCFGLGSLLWKVPSYQEEFTERIRTHMEAADNLQGFHVLLDGHDGFSGLGCSCLQYLRDEYSSKAVLAFLGLPSYYPNTSVVNDSKRVVNIALAMSSLPELSSVFCPISTMKEGWRKPTETRAYPFLNYNAELNYHTSAILAAGLETLTLGYRLRNSSMRLADMTSGLRVVGRAAVAASVALPFPMYADQSLMKTLADWNGPLFYSMTPYCNLKNIDLQSVSTRGIPKDRLFEKVNPGFNTSDPAYSCRSVEEMISMFISCDLTGSPKTYSCSSEVKLKTIEPFPSIFDESLISSEGDLKAYSTDGTKGVREVPALAGLHSTEGLNNMLTTLHDEAKKINIKLLPGLADSGIELLEWQENLEKILCLSECYIDN